jgi:tetratricopeptide (TPR) repeat protein
MAEPKRPLTGPDTVGHGPAEVRPLPDIYAELGWALLADGRQQRAAGKTERARRRFAAATSAFREVLLERPDAAEVQLGLAEALAGEQRELAALQAWMEAVRLRSSLARAVLPRAGGLLTPELAERLKVERWGSIVLASGPLDRPDQEALRSFLGKASFLRGDYAAAVEHWQGALGAKPDGLVEQESLGEALWRAGRTAEAEETLERAALQADRSGDPERAASARLIWARVLLDQGRHDRVEPILRQARLQSPRLAPQIELALARSRVELGRADEALLAAEQALSHGELTDELRVEADTVRAAALYELQRYAEAADASERVLQLAPGHTEAIRIRAQAMLDGGFDVQQAIQLLQLYIMEQPADLERRRLLVAALRRSDQPAEQVVAALQGMLTVTPPEAGREVHIELAEEYLRAGDPARAINALEDAGEQPGAEEARWWRLYGDALRQADQREAARQHYRRAWELDPTDVALLERYGELLDDLDDQPAALEVWRELVRQRPEDPEAALHLATALSRISQPADALQALRPGLDASDHEVAARANELAGDLLQTLGRPSEEIAQALYEAGRRRYWRDEIPVAASLLKRARRHQRTLQPIYWYLADCRLVQSYLDRPPYVHERWTRRARAAWECGAAMGPPEPAFYWTYLGRARISEQEGRLSSTNATDKYWESIVFLERALLLEAGDARCWAALAGYHRSLDNVGNALAALAEALELDEDMIEVLDERAAILINVGDDEAADEVLEKRRLLQAEPWADALKAIVLIRKQQYSQALELLSAAINASPREMWYRDLRALCYHRMRDIPAARQDWRWIWWRHGNQAYARDAITIAWAAYSLATTAPRVAEQLLANAIDILSEQYQREDPDEDILRRLGLCLLARGDAARGDLEEGERLLARGIGKARLAPDLEDLLVNLEELRGVSEQWPHFPGIEAALGRLQAKIEDRKAKLARNPSPLREFQRILARRPSGPEGDADWAWIGTQAGLARLAGQQHRWEEAARAYQLLAGQTALFPEAPHALAGLVEKLQRQGDDALRDGAAPAAAASYQQALSLWQAPEGDGDGRPAHLHTGLALAMLALDDLEAAGTHTERALELFAEPGEADPGAALGRAAAELLGGVQHYWSVDEQWARQIAQAGDAGRPPATRLTAARQAMAAFLDRHYGLDGGGSIGTNLPIVTPVVLEIGAGLTPSDTGPDWPLFKLYIPAMRDEILTRIGLSVPGVRVRRNDHLGDGDYVILLDEVPLLRGSVMLGMRYCPAGSDRLVKAGVPEDARVAATNPRNGHPGHWIAAKFWDAVLAGHLDLWEEPLVFVVHHLGAVIRGNLADFVGVQEVEALLETWGERQELRGLVGALPSDERRRLRVARVLHGLVSEGVPITAAGDLLELLVRDDLADHATDDLVAAARLRVRSQLPGNEHGAPRRELPDEWEARLRSWLTGQEGRWTLAAPPDEVHRLTSQLRSWPEAADPQLTLVVEDRRLRPLLRRLLAGDLPQLVVLAKEELVPDGERQQAAW